jgi:hypothetical protein
MVPIWGAEGVTGAVFIVTLEEGPDVHPLDVTVKVKVPAEMPEKVAVVPVDEMVDPPGEMVTIHVPEEGKPLRATLPVGRAHVGWVIAPITGAEGAEGGAGIKTSFDRPETHDELLVTVKLYVPADRPEIVTLVVLPPEDIPPGYLLSVQLPAGRPLNTTLPVGDGQVGTVIFPTTGGAGVEGCGWMKALPDEADMQPA